MKRWRPLHLFFALVVMCGLFFSRTPTTHGFRAHTFTTANTLLDVIDKPQWRIGYNFTFNCPAAFRKKEAELKEMILKSVQAWLQPLRERYPDRQFTDDFLLVRMPDVEVCEGEVFHNLFGEVDLRIVFTCEEGRSKAFLAPKADKAVPGVCMRNNENIKNMPSFFSILVHEVGHIFGLGDTYAEGPRVSTGGLSNTAGRQPSSLMAGSVCFERPDQIAEDDKNGIIWLYKWLYEDQPLRDCFFPDYHFVRGLNGGCEPKYPLIFEAKHGCFPTVEDILRNDPTLDINARDSSGFTALHHAVQRLDTKMVKALMAKPGIKVNLLNTHKRTPAQLARTLHQIHLEKMIKAHSSSKLLPIAWDVAPKGKLTTTWGHLKKQY